MKTLITLAVLLLTVIQAQASDDWEIQLNVSPTSGTAPLTVSVQMVVEENTDICDSSHLDLCANNSVCSMAGGYWWADGTCNSTEEQVCNYNNLDLCTTSSECTNEDGYWWSDNSCNSTLEPASCDIDNLDLCTSSSTCVEAGGYWWSNNTCNSTEEPPLTAVLDGSTILGNWDWAGTRPDGVSRGGIMSFSADGTYTYTLVDGDGQSNNSGIGGWALSGSNLNLSFRTGYIASWTGIATGDASSFTYNGHGNYIFTR